MADIGFAAWTETVAEPTTHGDTTDEPGDR